MADFFDLVNIHEDRRIKKTKKALRKSLFKLLEEKNISQITVTELALAADINRSTFYIYYDDVYDMIHVVEFEDKKLEFFHDMVGDESKCIFI